MCTSRPKAPAAPVARQAPRMPDAPELRQQSQDMLNRRATIASMVLTPMGGLGAAPTAGKTVLGA